MCRSMRAGMVRLGVRYRHAGAAAILVGIVLLAAVPIPGTCLLPLCVAKLALRAKV